MIGLERVLHSQQKAYSQDPEHALPDYTTTNKKLHEDARALYLANAGFFAGGSYQKSGFEKAANQSSYNPLNVLERSGNSGRPGIARKNEFARELINPRQSMVQQL
jgi:hypothetical protein